MRPVRVLIVEDHRMVAEGMRTLLEDEPDLRVVGLATTGAEALRLTAATRPDVVLIDFHLPDLSGSELAAALRQGGSRAALLFLSVDDRPSCLLGAVEAGACGFLHKSRSAPELVGAVRRAARGETLFPPATLAGLLDYQRRRAREEAGRHQDRLTPREREILGLLATGLDNRTVAHRLRIRYSTVRSHVRSLIGKLDAHSRLQAVARARELGLIDP
ncbi:MAG TPA: response regulator transcription factor [Candidatus Dormibacteraeota bacterium]|jgi:DNA-binding NarL/FixJ family response regulator|nr:response regulator transcription factor [Candidatus Dormibacteraeota bacterium]